MIIEIKWNAKNAIKSKIIKETKREGQPKGQNSEGKRFRRDRKKEGEEKNSSSTQANWGRREKSSLTTQENL